MTQYVIAALLLVCLGIFAFVVVCYATAFGTRGWLGNPRRFRASVRELWATLKIVPLFPFWWALGAKYKRELEAKRSDAQHLPVLLLHGFASNQTQWTWLGRQLNRLGSGAVYGRTYFSLQPLAVSAEALGRMVEEICARENCEQLNLVAHSLGGLVARYYIERLGGDKRVHTLVTMASPHGGTRLARLGFVPAARELVLGMPLPAKNPTATRYVSIWSPDDAIVQPAESASLAAWGRDYVFEGEGHLSMLFSRPIVERIALELAA